MSKSPRSRAAAYSRPTSSILASNSLSRPSIGVRVAQQAAGVGNGPLDATREVKDDRAHGLTAFRFDDMRGTGSPPAEKLAVIQASRHFPDQGGSGVRALEDVRSRPAGRIDCFKARTPFLDWVVALLSRTAFPKEEEELPMPFHRDISNTAVGPTESWDRARAAILARCRMRRPTPGQAERALVSPRASQSGDEARAAIMADSALGEVLPLVLRADDGGAL